MNPDGPAPARRVGRDSFAVLAATVAAAALAFGFVLLVARISGPAGRGVLAFVTPVPTLLSYTGTLGLETAALYFASKDESWRPALAAGAVVAAGASAVLAGCAWAVFAVYPDLMPSGVTLPDVGVALSAAPVMTLQFVLLSALLGVGDVRLSNAIRVAPPAVALVTLVAVHLVASPDDVSGTVVACWAGAQWAGAVVAVAVSRRKLGWANPVRVAQRLRTMVRYGLKAHVGVVADLATFRVDALILATSHGAVELGLYTAAVNVAETSLYLPSAVGMVVLPAGAARPPRAARTLTRRALVVVLAATATAAAVGTVAARPLVSLLFGDAFSESVAPLQILLLAMIGMGARRVAFSGLAAGGRQWSASAVSVATLVVVVALDFVLIPGHGAVGAAIASVVAYWFGGTFMSLLALRAPAARVVPPEEALRPLD